MKYLKDIKWSRIEDPKGFKLEFFFDTNPFFKNSVLTKTYHMVDEDDPILEKAIGLVLCTQYLVIFISSLGALLISEKYICISSFNTLVSVLQD